MTLESLTNTFYEEGESCNFGCHQDELDSMWIKVTDSAEYKSVFVVEDWMWLDIEMQGQ